MLELRPYQQEAVSAIYRHLREHDDNPCVVIPTGGGKTPVMATVCRDAVGRWGGRVLILAHVKELLEQALEKIQIVAPEMWMKTGVYSAGLKSRDTDRPITIAGIQSVYKRACELDAFDLVIIDECFVAGTPIRTPAGDVPIEQLHVGQSICTAVGVGTIEVISARKAEQLVQVETDDGITITCTPEHPFFTENGWIGASSMEIGTRLFREEDLRMLWSRFRTLDQAQAGWNGSQLYAGTAVEKAEVLLEILLKEVRKPHAIRDLAGQDASVALETTASTDQAGGQRPAAANPSAGVVARPRSGVASRACGDDGNAARQRHSPALQAGPCASAGPDRPGVGRRQSSVAGDSLGRHEEDHVLGGARVVRVTALESHGSVPVFNLHVREHPSYYAGGLLVHNCHMIPPDGEGMYRTFLEEARMVNPHLRVIGLTATPFRLKSGMICEPGNVLNEICYEIGVKELIVQGYLCPLVTKGAAQPLDTSGLHVRAGEFVAGEAEELMDTDELVESACREIVEQTQARRSVLVFATGVRHAEHVADVLRRMSSEPVAVVFGETASEERDRVLAEFKAGRVKYLVNVNVLTTGFDAPNIDCVAMVRPTLSPGLYYQMCLDMDTEVLTPRGWARCEQVDEGDVVGAYNLETGRIEWCRAEEKVHRPMAPGERMYVIATPHLDVRVTHLHTMIYRGRSATCKHWRQRTAESLATLRDTYLIPVAGNNDGPGVPLSDYELRFLGWMLTDGYRNPYNNAAIISQSSRSPWGGVIRATLDGCGFGYRMHRQKRLGMQEGYPDGVLFVIPYGEPRGANRGLKGWGGLSEYLNRPILESLADISRAQLRVLLGAMHLGDGVKRRGVPWRPRTKTLCLGDHKYLADQLQALFVMRGFRCNVAAARQRTSWHTGEPKTQYLLHIREQTEATVGGTRSWPSRLVKHRRGLEETADRQDEWVWCLRTRLGTLVTRRNGKVAIVGNCGRGFRIHPGKENCLVLDFGGNVLRHGPVDAIRVQAVNHRGNGEAPAKQCPECLSLIAAGYTVCPDCGFEFPPPERRQHEATASTEGILSGEVTTAVYEVQEVFYGVHTKKDAPEDAPKTLRVEYRVGLNQYYSEWICFEHDGWARYKAESWWRRRSNAPVPQTAAEAEEMARAGALCDTLSITVRTVVGEKYPRIIGYELGDWPVWENNSEFVEAMVGGTGGDYDPRDLDDIPF